MFKIVRIIVIFLHRISLENKYRRQNGHVDNFIIRKYGAGASDDVVGGVGDGGGGVGVGRRCIENSNIMILLLQ